MEIVKNEKIGETNYFDNTEEKLELDKALIEKYLADFAQFYKNNGGKEKFELIITGGAALVLAHNFRQKTSDIDATFPKNDIIRKSMQDVVDKHKISKKWLNSAIEDLDPAWDKLTKYSKVYKVYEKLVTVKIVDTDHIVAQKLKAWRESPIDRVDILDIIQEEKERNHPLTMKRINKAVDDLYGGWDLCPQSHRHFLEIISKIKDLGRIRDAINKRDTVGLFWNHEIVAQVKAIETFDEFKMYTLALGIIMPNKELVVQRKRILSFNQELSDDELDNVSGGCNNEKHQQEIRQQQMEFWATIPSAAGGGFVSIPSGASGIDW